LTNGCEADGEEWGPDASGGVKFGKERGRRDNQGMIAGESRYRCKAIAQGRPGVSAEPVCSCAFLLCNLNETAGQRAPGFCTLWLEGVVRPRPTLSREGTRCMFNSFSPKASRMMGQRYMEQSEASLDDHRLDSAEGYGTGREVSPCGELWHLDRREAEKRWPATRYWLLLYQPRFLDPPSRQPRYRIRSDSGRKNHRRSTQ